MSVQLQLGLEVIHSYKRLAYTPWHAIAEFVDNSTQSYFNNQEALDEALSDAGENLNVSVVYDPQNGGILRVYDNAMGMSLDELRDALKVGLPPAITTGRSKYGMGMKTAACWIGDLWTVRTKKLGETEEHSITVDVADVGAGERDLPYECFAGKSESDHHTILEIRQHHKVFRGRTLGKIKDFLRSIYRQDLKNGLLVLEWQNSPLVWSDSDFPVLKAEDGSPYRKNFSFAVGGKNVNGWVAILEKGGRSRAGFSILHAGRVVRGWPESWRPESLYGQDLGSNSLVNQRLFGEIYLDDFDVSHTKDDIIWAGGEEEEVERKLEEECRDYARRAESYRKRDDDERGPTDIETKTAIQEFEQELQSPEFQDVVSIDIVPPPAAIQQSFKPLREWANARQSNFEAKHPGFVVQGFLKVKGSVNDPYVVVDAVSDDKITVIINTEHPHWRELRGSDGVLNYLRHCTFDAIAEWQARRKASHLDPDTIKLLKDKLLRVPLEIEMHQGLDASSESD